MSLSPAAKQVVEVVEGAAGALADNFSLHDVWGTSAKAPWIDPASVPPLWCLSLDELAVNERRVLTNALGTPVFNLGIKSVGIIRQLPERELLRAKYIGPISAAILKALGHYAERETGLEAVIDPKRYNTAALSAPVHQIAANILVQNLVQEP